VPRDAQGPDPWKIRNLRELFPKRQALKLNQAVVLPQFACGPIPT
jgi:hypothetical protein